MALLTPKGALYVVVRSHSRQVAFGDFHSADAVAAILAPKRYYTMIGATQDLKLTETDADEMKENTIFPWYFWVICAIFLRTGKSERAYSFSSD